MDIRQGPKGNLTTKHTRGSHQAYPTITIASYQQHPRLNSQKNSNKPQKKENVMLFSEDDHDDCDVIFLRSTEK